MNAEEFYAPVRPKEQKEFFPGDITSVNRDGSSILIQSNNGVQLRITVETDYIIRCRYATDGFFQPDFSYATYKGFEGGYTLLEVEEMEDCWQIRTSAVKICAKKRNMKLIFSDAKTGKEINRDEKGFHWEEHPSYGGNIVMMSKVVQQGEHYYGLGDKAMQMNLRGKRVKNWGTDEYGYGKERDPLYKNIPFYTAIHNGLSYGIFFDNSFKLFFDFASERQSTCSFWSHGGEMNYYFIYGPKPLEVVERYANLTGKPELPPLWALGFHQCKWSYYPESTVREICSGFRERQIPCDAIYLDIDYMDGYRCFTWDPERFPEPTKMVDELLKDGFKTVAIIDPGIKIDPEYEVFREGFENGYFCKRADGDMMKGKVWPGECYFVDFTNPKARDWWAGLFKGLIAENGIRGIWNDMNEPAIFDVESKTFPPDVRHDYDGHPCSHRKAHNVYGMQMARATFHGVKENGRPNRPFVITRSMYSGAQRYSATWTGDNIATWEHLWLANIQCQRLAISGQSLVGSDIGGFTEHPGSELFARWIQLGVFHPMMRVHSSGDHGEQEPWSFSDETTDISRKFIELRYELLPYLYTTFWQNTRSGIPMLRPLAFLDASDQNALHRNEEFLYGDHILACPIVEPGATHRFMYLPEGRWYQYFHNTIHKGGREIQVQAPLDEMPILVRAGAIIPMYPVMQYVGEKPVETLRLRTYFDTSKTRSELYEDAGDGYEYKKGKMNVKTFTQNSSPERLTIHQHVSGKFKTTYQEYQLELIGLPFEPKTLKIDDYEVAAKFEKQADGSYHVIVGHEFASIKISG
ncbi:MAG: glycoside hydrolase family 31 protein [Flavobacteriales bacterium]|nr:glycoside hydrolase family 31 protein [Flavobacteriales bacterium]